MAYGIAFCLLLQGDVVQAIARLRKLQERRAEALWPLMARLMQGEITLPRRSERLTTTAACWNARC